MAPPLDTAARRVVADPMVPRIGRVRRRWREAPLTWTLDIEAEKDSADIFEPGQFNMLTVFGIGEVPISVSGDPAEHDRLIHTVRAVGRVSTALTELEPGTAVGLRGPFGSSWPIAEASGRDVVVMAGGLGLAPLRPAIYRLLAERARYGKITLLYGTRSPGDILFRRELESWRRKLDIDLQLTVDIAGPDWHGHVGVVTNLIPGIACDPARAVALVCGPEVMMRFSIAALRTVGIADNQMYLSMERNMKCALGFCGHCQFGPVFVCRDGPVFRHDRLRDLLPRKEI